MRGWGPPARAEEPPRESKAEGQDGDAEGMGRGRGRDAGASAVHREAGGHDASVLRPQPARRPAPRPRHPSRPSPRPPPRPWPPQPPPPHARTWPSPRPGSPRKGEDRSPHGPPKRQSVATPPGRPRRRTPTAPRRAPPLAPAQAHAHAATPRSAPRTRAGARRRAVLRPAGRHGAVLPREWLRGPRPLRPEEGRGCWPARVVPPTSWSQTRRRWGLWSGIQLGRARRKQRGAGPAGVRGSCAEDALLEADPGARDRGCHVTSRAALWRKVMDDLRLRKLAENSWQRSEVCSSLHSFHQTVFVDHQLRSRCRGCGGEQDRPTSIELAAQQDRRTTGKSPSK